MRISLLFGPPTAASASPVRRWRSRSSCVASASSSAMDCRACRRARPRAMRWWPVDAVAELGPAAAWGGGGRPCRLGPDAQEAAARLVDLEGAGVAPQVAELAVAVGPRIE